MLVIFRQLFLQEFLEKHCSESLKKFAYETSEWISTDKLLGKRLLKLQNYEEILWKFPAKVLEGFHEDSLDKFIQKENETCIIKSHAWIFTTQRSRISDELSRQRSKCLIFP